MLQQAKDVLHHYFGYDAFKDGQEKLIDSILNGQDAVGIMPTGAGKSVCYQVPAVVMDGITLVVSPLISLMKDQVDALNQMGISAALINSTLSAKEIRECFEQMTEGAYKIVYVAPERLESPQFIQRISSLSIPLVAVDEAHCVSQWGHDFRPSYLSISSLLEHIHPRPVVAAFTATATDQVKVDVIDRLRMDNPTQVTTGYERSNLTFSVLKGVNKKDFLQRFLHKQENQSGIIYAATRKEVDSCAAWLQSHGFSAGRYHAGMSEEERAEQQEAFLYDEIRIMVATNAFGMGIDKSNVRYVIHYNLPKNIESYYQEAGRAGRDGEPGECVLLYAPQDVMTQKFLIEQGDPDRQESQLANLHAMVDYCHTTDCLQRHIVEYFGDLSGSDCGKCGNCTDERERVDITVEAQKIFSCVARMRQRFGITLTAKVLRGAKDQKVKQFRFDELPTYGVMKGYKEKEITQLIQVLVADGYLSLADSRFPTLTLNEKARAVLSGQEQVHHRMTLVPETQTAEREHDEELFEALRALRKSFAEKQKVPPFTIFHDATLREMAILLPQTEEELLRVKGVGQAKLKKYGADFLSCIAQHRI